jgi:flagellar biosynthetic protein FliP
MTAFLRILIVLGFLRFALGLQQMPPNQVLVGLSLFLTWIVMGDVAGAIHQRAITPYLEGRVTEVQMIEKAAEPMRAFMLAQTREKDLALMMNLAKVGRVSSLDEIPVRVVVPSFFVSELRTAFAIGFLLFIPFLIIDLSTAALLNALGMIMLPPAAIAMPFKVLVFVVADGWALVVGSIVRSFVT